MQHSRVENEKPSSPVNSATSSFKTHTYRGAAICVLDCNHLKYKTCFLASNAILLTKTKEQIPTFQLALKMSDISHQKRENWQQLLAKPSSSTEQQSVEPDVWSSNVYAAISKVENQTASEFRRRSHGSSFWDDPMIDFCSYCYKQCANSNL